MSRARILLSMPERPKVTTIVCLGLAKEIVDLHPDAIVAEATPAIAAAQRATKTIPIIMAPATDPVGSGFVKSFAHPGGNITGVANMFADLTAKSLEVLHGVLPNAKTVAVLMSVNPTHAQLYEVASAGAKAIGLSTVPFVAATPTHLERTFQEIKQEKCDALYTLADPYRPRIPQLAGQYRDSSNLPVWLLRRDWRRPYELRTGRDCADCSCGRFPR